MRRQILIAKSGISNHAAAGIRECPNVVKPRIITDASHGMEEIHEFCFKEFAAVCLFWNFFVL